MVAATLDKEIEMHLINFRVLAKLVAPGEVLVRREWWSWGDALGGRSPLFRSYGFSISGWKMVSKRF